MFYLGVREGFDFNFCWIKGKSKGLFGFLMLLQLLPSLVLL